MAQGSVSRRGWGVATALLTALAACAEPAKQAPPAQPSKVEAPPVQTAPPKPAPPPAAPKDACGAASMQYLVGKPRTQIPVPVYPAMRRVVCSTCVMTQDYLPTRMTIIYSSDTGLVTSVRCG